MRWYLNEYCAASHERREETRGHFREFSPVGKTDVNRLDLRLGKGCKLCEKGGGNQYCARSIRRIDVRGNPGMSESLSMATRPIQLECYIRCS